VPASSTPRFSLELQMECVNRPKYLKIIGLAVILVSAIVAGNFPAARRWSRDSLDPIALVHFPSHATFLKVSSPSTTDGLT
jgi:hypothetical protein